MARALGHETEMPVIAVVAAWTGAILAKARNRVEVDRDPTAHAEMLAIRAAAADRPKLVGCDLCVTLEPCRICVQEIAFARIRRFCFGAPYPRSGGFSRRPSEPAFRRTLSQVLHFLKQQPNCIDAAAAGVRKARPRGQVVAAGQAVRQASEERHGYLFHAVERRQPSGKDAGNATVRDDRRRTAKNRNSANAAL